jgi:hypothetical protein
MLRLIDEGFEAAVPTSLAWNHLEQVENWPTWAKHIQIRGQDSGGSTFHRNSGDGPSHQWNDLDLPKIWLPLRCNRLFKPVTPEKRKN